MGGCPLGLHISLFGHMFVYPRGLGHLVTCMEFYAETCGVP